MGAAAAAMPSRQQAQVGARFVVICSVPDAPSSIDSSYAVTAAWSGAEDGFAVGTHSGEPCLCHQLGKLVMWVQQTRMQVSNWGHVGMYAWGQIDVGATD